MHKQFYFQLPLCSRPTQSVGSSFSFQSDTEISESDIISVILVRIGIFLGTKGPQMGSRPQGWESLD